MPLVRMLTSVAGPRTEWVAGELVEMSAKEAAVWADGERGELVRDEPPTTPERRRRRPETPENSV